MLEKVKIALRISHNFLDSDIEDTITLARSEMVRAGVDPEIAFGDLAIIEGAIKTFCQYRYERDPKISEGFFNSWQYQLDNIRKSKVGGSDDVQ